MSTALLLSLIAAAPLYVQETHIDLREEADGEARGVATLRINTAVVPLDEEGAWVRVGVAGRPEEHPVEGWVPAADLAAEPLTVMGASRAGWDAYRAGDEAGAVAWAERQLVLAGEAALADPVALYRDAGRVHEPAATDGPVHLAACDGRRAEYLGSFDGDWDFAGGWRAQLAGPRDPLEPAEVDRFLADLSGRHWITFTPGDEPPHPLEGSPFVRPFVVGTWNEEYRVFGDGGEDGGGESTLVLGPCGRAGEVYASRPLGQARPSRPGSGEIERLTSTLVPRREGYEVSAVATGSYSGLREAVADFTGPGGPDGVFTARRWVLHGGMIRGEAEVSWFAGAPDPIPERTWFAPATRVLVGVMPTTSNEKSFNRGFVVVVWRPAGARFVSVLTEGSGC